MLSKYSKYLVVLVLASLVLVACGAGGNSGNNNANNSGNANAATNNDNDADAATNDTDDSVASSEGMAAGSIEADAVLDPAIASEGDVGVLQASGYLYDTLVNEVDGEIVEGLASEWSVSDDGLTYSFRLRANAVFSDGTPINTDVVVENYTRWFDPEHALHGDSSQYEAWVVYFDDFLVRDLEEDEAPPSKFDGIEKDDNLVFLIHLNKPMDDFLNIIAMPQFSVLNPTALAADGYGTATGPVVGSGAYQVDSWSADGLVLVLHDGYWGEPGSFNQIVFAGE